MAEETDGRPARDRGEPGARKAFGRVRDHELVATAVTMIPATSGMWR